MNGECDAAVEALLGHLATKLGLYAQRPIEWPDELNRETEEIDAIIKLSDGSILALEHTRIEGMSSHLKMESHLERFADAVVGLPSDGLMVSVNISREMLDRPDFIMKGPSELKQFLVAMAGRFAGEERQIDLPSFPAAGVLDSWEGQAAEIRVWATSDGTQNHAATLEHTMRERLDHKRSRLLELRELGYRAVLLLELLDYSATSPASIKRAYAIAVASGAGQHLDAVWMIRGKIGSHHTVWRLDPPSAL